MISTRSCSAVIRKLHDDGPYPEMIVMAVDDTVRRLAVVMWIASWQSQKGTSCSQQGIGKAGCNRRRSGTHPFLPCALPEKGGGSEHAAGSATEHIAARPLLKTPSAQSSVICLRKPAIPSSVTPPTISHLFAYSQVDVHVDVSSTMYYPPVSSQCRFWSCWCCPRCFR